MIIPSISLLPKNSDGTDYDEDFISGMTVQKDIAAAARKNKKYKLVLGETRKDSLSEDSYDEEVAGSADAEKTLPQQPKVFNFSDSDGGTTD